MAYTLLQKRDKGLHLASCLEKAMQSVQHCALCRNYTDEPLCGICQNTNRNLNVICVVESPIDVIAIEQSQVYQGSYFVLMGCISPLDGIGPDEIGLPKLKQRLTDHPVDELILALSPGVEGQTTIYFIQELLQKSNIKISQLAHGIPSGGELEFLDSHTIGSAFKNRQLSFSNESQQMTTNENT